MAPFMWDLLPSKRWLRRVEGLTLDVDKVWACWLFVMGLEELTTEHDTEKYHERYPLRSDAPGVLPMLNNCAYTEKISFPCLRPSYSPIAAAGTAIIITDREVEVRHDVLFLRCMVTMDTMSQGLDGQCYGSARPNEYRTYITSTY